MDNLAATGNHQFVLLRPTAKLLKVFGRPWSTQLVEAPASPEDWYGNLLWIEGRKCILLTHAGTLFTVFVPDVPVSDLRPPDRFVTDAIGDALSRADLPPATFGDLDAHDFQLAKTASRTVLGAMNDMAFSAEHVILPYGDLASTDFDEIDRMLWNNIVSSTGYIPPIEAARTLAAGGPMPAAKKPRIYGPEVWSTVAGCEWFHWDLWFCMIALDRHGGDLSALRESFVDDLKTAHDEFRRRAAESKLSHLAGLERRLDQAGLAPADLVSPETLADKSILGKARTKVASAEIQARAMTLDMAETPRVVLRSRAYTGHRDTFPIDPERYVEEFRAGVQASDFIPVGRTVSFTRRMRKLLVKLDAPRLTSAERLALYRAFHTAGLESQERADDSYGEIGRMREDAWFTYLGLDWRGAGMAPEDYWFDLCELRVWENYGLAHDNQTATYRQAREDEAILIEEILVGLESELREVWIDFHADEARDQIAWLQLGLDRVDHFAEAAARIGSASWQPIVAMAKAALRAGRPDMAEAVFAAADRPGFQRDHLRKVRAQLVGGPPFSRTPESRVAPRPTHLRVVH